MIRRYEECVDVLYVLVRLYLVVFHFTWFLSAGHLDCGCMCQTTLIKSLCLWWFCSLRLNLHVHRYFGQEGFIIMPWLFHGDPGGWLPRHRYSYATEKCFEDTSHQAVVQARTSAGARARSKKGLNCLVRCLFWSRNTQTKKAPVNSMPSLDLPVHPTCAKFALLNLNPCICEGLPFAVCHARRLAAMHWVILVTDVRGVAEHCWHIKNPETLVCNF